MELASLAAGLALKILPDVAPVAKTVPGFDLTSWNGIFGPAGRPKPIVDRGCTENPGRVIR